MNHPLIRHLPLESAEDAAVDPSTADLTGRVLHFLGEKAGFSVKHHHIQRAVNWLYENQEHNGSWYGRWGVCYIYGTWAALTGMHACGVVRTHPSIQKAIRWLKTIQNDDGSWGESCKSAEVKTYVPLKEGTIIQTAWALDALLLYEKPSHPAIVKGMNYLMDSSSHDGRSLTYPVGIGLPKQFYIRYHSYPYVFPLLAVGKYLNSIEKETAYET